MRIFRGLENIHAVIDRHEAEWRKDNGEEPEHSRLPSLEEAVRRRLTAQPSEGSGKFAADRFLSGKTEPVSLKKPPVSEPETVSVEPDTVPEDTERHSWLYNEVMKAVNKASAGRKDTKVVAVFVPVIQSAGEAREIPADGPEVPDDGENAQAVEIIKNKDGKHSRLYDEVMRAVNDSAGDARKIVAVFVPLLQDGKEFENLPADDTVTLPPVSEDAVRVEAVAENLPAEPETITEAVPEIDEAPALLLIAEPEAVIELEPQEIPEPEDGVTEEILAPLPEEAEPVPEITEEIPEPETESEPSAEGFNLIPEGQAEPDAELAEAFREMEEKLDDALQDEHAQELTEDETVAVIVPEETEQETEALIIPEEIPGSETESEPAPLAEDETQEQEQEIIAPETDNDDYEDEILQDGEPMEFEELDSVGQQPAEEITAQEEFIDLPDSLDDDEIVDDGEFDETLTEIHKPDDGEETVIIGEVDEDFPPDDDDEIELLPDPV